MSETQAEVKGRQQGDEYLAEIDYMECNEAEKYGYEPGEVKEGPIDLEKQ